MVRTGLERLVYEEPQRLRGRRIGLVTHPAAVLPDLTAAVEALAAAGAQITALFGPEHGFDGAAPDATAVEHATHPRLGAPIYSLYGATHAPTPAMLADVDLLIFDTQDVGVRFYTFSEHALPSAAQRRRIGTARAGARPPQPGQRGGR
jgi:uncharacterized protein YbbC (DUF1343 family)